MRNTLEQEKYMSMRVQCKQIHTSITVELTLVRNYKATDAVGSTSR